MVGGGLIVRRRRRVLPCAISPIRRNSGASEFAREPIESEQARPVRERDAEVIFRPSGAGSAHGVLDYTLEVAGE